MWQGASPSDKPSSSSSSSSRVWAAAGAARALMGVNSDSSSCSLQRIRCALHIHWRRVTSSLQRIETGFKKHHSQVQAVSAAWSVDQATTECRPLELHLVRSVVMRCCLSRFTGGNVTFARSPSGVMEYEELPARRGGNAAGPRASCSRCVRIR